MKISNLNFNHFKMVENMGLKIAASRSRTKFNVNLPSGSKVISGGETDRLVI
jgi:hypothetical protein